MRRASWSACRAGDDPAAFVRTVSRAYRRDFWKQQPKRVEVWSEKGTVRGVLQPVLDQVRRRLPGHARLQRRDLGLRHRPRR